MSYKQRDYGKKFYCSLAIGSASAEEIKNKKHVQGKSSTLSSPPRSLNTIFNGKKNPEVILVKVVMNRQTKLKPLSLISSSYDKR